ncbi:MAG: hypothetical protein V1755_05285, partial [Chloroflexota bacterium]
ESGKHEDWWPQAITVACGANKRSWQFMRGILRNCLQEGHPPSASGNGRGPKRERGASPDDTPERRAAYGAQT